MKSNLIKNYLLIFSCLLLCNICNAQKNNVNFASLKTKGVFGISYERALFGQSTLSMGLEIQSQKEGRDRKFLKEDEFDYKNKGKGFQLEYRYYFEREKGNLQGFYGAAHYGFRKHTLTYLSRLPEDNFYANNELLADFFPPAYYFLGAVDAVFGSDYVNVDTHQKVRRMGFGLGYKFHADVITIDIGGNLSFNKTKSGEENFRLPDGNVKVFNRDINGSNGNLYLSLGCVF